MVVEIAVNLAVALANKCQLKVGLLDADVYGPSVPTMMNIHKKPEANKGNILILEGSIEVILSTVEFLYCESFYNGFKIS